MPKYLIANNILTDGLGDFTHFEDIIHALLSSDKYKDFEFIAYVCYSGKESANYLRIKAKLDALGIYYVFGTADELKNLLLEKLVKDKLHNVDQVIVISQDPPYYTNAIKYYIPIKVVFEHELPERITRKYSFQCSFGLQSSSKGIKIKPIERLDSAQAWKIIKENDSKFAQSLLINCHAEDFAEFIGNYSLIPAYFNSDNDSDFMAFLGILAANTSYPKDKNIAIYQSGSYLKNFLQSKYRISAFLKGSNIRELEIIKAGETNPIVIEGNPAKTKTISLFSGFYLKDNSYTALYHLAQFAFISGDTSFERTISMNIFPYYHPSYVDIKKPSLEALRKISQMFSLDISPEVRAMYDIYFNVEHLKRHKKIINDQVVFTEKRNLEHELSPYANLDFQKMIEEWPKITRYLNQYHNFYHKMDAFMLADLPEEEFEAALIGETSLNI